MSAVDLLPCPFCGEPPFEYQATGGQAAACDECGFEMLADDWNRRAPVSAGKVKALVWGDGTFSDQPAWFADTAFGCLMVVDHLIHGNGIQAYDVAGESIGIFPDVPAAKAAAQADYEARILAQLQPGDGWQDRTENMQSAYLAGFYASAEGYNAEYPFDQRGIEPFEDEEWCKHREVALARLDATPPASLPQNNGEG